jgi:cytochrome c oxidase assembly protein subunit 15
MNLKNEIPSSRPVAIWLLTGVGMIMIQVVLGGITRLTGSGLSITEWKPLLGTLPPLNEADWQHAFDQYKQIGQFKKINFDFTLSEFKFIYFWEWFHREWARLIGVVFAVPFIIFILQKRFKSDMIYPMVILFLLGGFQGAIGWIMVQSGLNEEDIHVNHIRLAVHFIAALGLLVYTLWFALMILVPNEKRMKLPAQRKILGWIIAVLTLQLIYGAFMAGLKAATMAPTWPTINGDWLPHGGQPVAGFRYFTDNPFVVHFIHRGLAYLLFIMIIWWWWRSKTIQMPEGWNRIRNLIPILVIIQVILGILTVLHAPLRYSLLGFGITHQFVAMLLLVILVTMYYGIGRKTNN